MIKMMKKIKVPSYFRKNKKGKKIKVKGYTRKKRPKGKKKKKSAQTYKVKVIRDEHGRVIGTEWLGKTSKGAK